MDLSKLATRTLGPSFSLNGAILFCDLLEPLLASFFFYQRHEAMSDS